MSRLKNCGTNMPSNRWTRTWRRFSFARPANRKRGPDARAALSAVPHGRQPAESSVETAQETEVSRRRHRRRALLLLLLLPICFWNGTEVLGFVSTFWRQPGAD